MHVIHAGIQGAYKVAPDGKASCSLSISVWQVSRGWLQRSGSKPWPFSLLALGLSLPIC